MYREFSEFLGCPPDGQVVWRYMGLSRFLWMLKEGKLYFSRPAEFKDDPYEGIPSGKGSQIEPNLKIAHGLARKLAAISCWHMNDCESVAMWKLYVEGPDGVAIQSRISALKRLDERSPFVIGKVEYINNYETEPQRQFIELLRWLQPYLPIFQKRKSYQHEQEARVVLLNPADIPGQARVPPERDAGDTGFGAPIHLSDLIERIVVSPEFPPFAIAALQQDVDAAGLKIGIEKSDLLKQPNKECDEALQRLIQLASSRT